MKSKTRKEKKEEEEHRSDKDSSPEEVEEGWLDAALMDSVAYVDVTPRLKVGDVFERGGVRLKVTRILGRGTRLFQGDGSVAGVCSVRTARQDKVMVKVLTGAKEEEEPAKSGPAAWLQQSPASANHGTVGHYCRFGCVGGASCPHSPMAGQTASAAVAPPGTGVLAQWVEDNDERAHGLFYQTEPHLQVGDYFLSVKDWFQIEEIVDAGFMAPTLDKNGVEVEQLMNLSRVTPVKGRGKGRGKQRGAESSAMYAMPPGGGSYVGRPGRATPGGTPPGQPTAADAPMMSGDDPLPPGEGEPPEGTDVPPEADAGMMMVPTDTVIGAILDEDGPPGQAGQPKRKVQVVKFGALNCLTEDCHHGESEPTLHDMHEAFIRYVNREEGGGTDRGAGTGLSNDDLVDRALDHLRGNVDIRGGAGKGSGHNHSQHQSCGQRASAAAAAARAEWNNRRDNQKGKFGGYGKHGKGKHWGQGKYGKGQYGKGKRDKGKHGKGKDDAITFCCFHYRCLAGTLPSSSDSTVENRCFYGNRCWYLHASTDVVDSLVQAYGIVCDRHGRKGHCRHKDEGHHP